ncbi:hypothetical protein K438DRAFT_2131408 [Mycena galopus ATCC 62051]|nr:hypothetical protein K438DRAFT_2131408 [Mycena galopus ATCC 62051]
MYPRPPCSRSRIHQGADGRAGLGTPPLRRFLCGVDAVDTDSWTFGGMRHLGCAYRLLHPTSSSLRLRHVVLPPPSSHPPHRVLVPDLRPSVHAPQGTCDSLPPRLPAPSDARGGVGGWRVTAHMWTLRARIYVSNHSVHPHPHRRSRHPVQREGGCAGAGRPGRRLWIRVVGVRRRDRFVRGFRATRWWVRATRRCWHARDAASARSRRTKVVREGYGSARGRGAAWFKAVGVVRGKKISRALGNKWEWARLRTPYPHVSSPWYHGTTMSSMLDAIPVPPAAYDSRQLRFLFPSYAHAPFAVSAVVRCLATIAPADVHISHPVPDDALESFSHYFKYDAAFCSSPLYHLIRTSPALDSAALEAMRACCIANGSELGTLSCSTLHTCHRRRGGTLVIFDLATGEARVHVAADGG